MFFGCFEHAVHCLAVSSISLILVISCLGNEGLWQSVAMLLNREPFVSDSGDCQRTGRERKEASW